MKERIREAAGSYFISVTLINAAMLILGSLLSPQQRFGYEAFLYPLVYGLIGIIPSLIISTEKLAGHSENFRDDAASEFGLTFVPRAAKALALTALDLIEQPDLLDSIKAEHREAVQRQSEE